MKVSAFTVFGFSIKAVTSFSTYNQFHTINWKHVTTNQSQRGKPLKSGANVEDFNDEAMYQSRRSILRNVSVLPFMTLMPISPAFGSSLLEDFGSDPNKIDEKKQVEKIQVVAKSKGESDIEPNLRSNYYYPTNKKRYLPRIKKCNDAIPLVAESIGSGDWDAVNDFATVVADDTILPLKLYTSSLTGGGTNVKVSYTKDMMKSAEIFEKSQKALVKAVGKRDQQAASKALEDMASALLTYRTAGKLLGPDGGGDIPSVDDIRRAASRTQKLTFEKRLSDRDSRVSQQNSSN